MRVLKATIVTMLLTATEALASGGGESGEGLSFMLILFMGFGAVIIVFQIFPALILFCGMAKGILSAKKSMKETATESSDKP